MQSEGGVRDIFPETASASFQEISSSPFDVGKDCEDKAVSSKRLEAVPDSTHRTPSLTPICAANGDPRMEEIASSVQDVMGQHNHLNDVASPVPGRAVASLNSLSEVVLTMLLSFLDGQSLDTCSMLSKALQPVAHSDELWRIKCEEDWGETRLVLPSSRETETLAGYRETWRAWKKAFEKYDAVTVKRVAAWWRSMEEWMSRELPEVVASLNPGVSERDLDRAEESLGWVLPEELRLMYRFHNGQWLPWDDSLDPSLGPDEARPRHRPNIPGSGSSLGLLGGYSFYNHMVTSKLFSLQRGVAASLAMSEVMTGEHRDFFQAGARRWNMEVNDIRSRGGFLLAGSHDMSKRAWVDRHGNVRFDPKVSCLLGVFDAAPVSASTRPSAAAARGTRGARNASSSGEGKGVQGEPEVETKGSRPRGNLLTWLEEYLRRLREGHYGVKSNWREASDIGNEALGPGGRPLSDSEAERGSRSCARGVWLFPQPSAKGCEVSVTQGVQVTVAPVFVPEACATRRDLMWSYTVTMELLRDDPSRPPGMTSCQLSMRHWEIDGPEGFHRTISGEGVIGYKPLLKLSSQVIGGASAGASSTTTARPASSVTPFEYQSCTGLEEVPGTMHGYFTFTPGSLELPTGPSFKARVPVFDLVLPDFIF